MELMAVIVGLEAIKLENQQVMVYSDSKYVIDSVEKNGFSAGLESILKERKIKIFGSAFIIYTENTKFLLLG